MPPFTVWSRGCNGSSVARAAPASATSSATVHPPNRRRTTSPNWPYSARGSRPTRLP